MNELIVKIVTILRNRIEGLTDIRRVNEEIKLLELITQLEALNEDPNNDPVTPADLATVATTGEYSDLLNLPTLGTAAAADSTAFATAAQGTLANTATQPGDLAIVATTGSYSDLSNTPVLGTAAEADAGDFATAAQGTLAGTSTQPGDNVSTLTNDAGYITGTTGFSGSFATATDTITVVNGLITAVTPL